MASHSVRILPAGKLKASYTQPDDQVFDGGAYNTLQIQQRVLAAGSAGTMRLEHTAVLEADAWIALTSTVSLSTPSNTLVTVSNFLRYLRVTTSSDVAGDPVALIDIIAKE